MWWQTLLWLLGVIALLFILAMVAVYFLFWRIGKWWDG